MKQIDHKDGDPLNSDIPNLAVKWTIEDCDTCSYWNESGYRNGLKAGYSLGRTCDHNEYQRQLYAHGYPRPAFMGCGTAETTADLAASRRYRDELRQMLEDVLDAFDPMIFGPMDWEENSKQAVVIERARGVLGHDQE